MIVIAVSKTKRSAERIGSIIKEIATCRLFNLGCHRALVACCRCRFLQDDRRTVFQLSLQCRHHVK
jgi:hypothetical protein